MDRQQAEQHMNKVMEMEQRVGQRARMIEHMAVEHPQEFMDGMIKMYKSFDLSKVPPEMRNMIEKYILTFDGMDVKEVNLSDEEQTNFFSYIDSMKMLEEDKMVYDSLKEKAGL